VLISTRFGEDSFPLLGTQRSRFISQSSGLLSQLLNQETFSWAKSFLTSGACEAMRMANGNDIGFSIPNACPNFDLGCSGKNKTIESLSDPTTPESMVDDQHATSTTALLPMKGNKDS
jgi:hypothetical protein